MFVPDDGTATLYIAVKRLKDHCYNRGMDWLCSAPLEKHNYQFILKNGGVEPDRVAYYKRKLLGPVPIDPLILVDWGDGDFTVVDGNHRLCALYELGAESFTFYLVPRRELNPFLIS